MRKNNKNSLGRWAFILLLTVLLPLRTYAVNSTNSTLSIERTTIKAGETKEIHIVVNNPNQEVTAVEFYMWLPSGLEVAKENDEFLVDIVGRTTYKDHSLKAKKTTTGMTHVMLYSSNNKPLNGTSGAVIGITLTASNTFNGGVIILEDQVLTSPDESKTESKPANYSYVINGGEHNISFNDPNVEAICVKNWDFDRNGFLSKSEAAIVTSLGDAFKKNKIITSFDELQYFTGLTKLNSWAFSNCPNLTLVTLPTTITEIDENAFTASGLTSLYIPASVTTIGGSALAGCKSLTAFTVEDGNSSFTVADGILYNKDITTLICCPAGKEGTVSLPATVSTIEDNGFYDCSKLTAINLPASLVTIGAATFAGCSSLTTLTLPESVRNIGTGCFTGCTNLESFTVQHSESNPFWHYRDFDGVLYQTKVTGEPYILVAYPNKHGDTYSVLEGIYFIESYAFCMTDIKNLTLPSFNGAGELAFGYCSKLTTVTSNVTVPSSVYGCFDNSTANATLYIPKGTTELYKASGGWDKFNNIVEVANEKAAEVFADTEKKNFYKVTGENTVALVKHVGFTQNLTIPASVPNGGKTWQVTGVGSGEEYVELLAYRTVLRSVEIPEGVKKIESHAFYECSYLTSLTVPNTTEEIGAWAFYGCPLSTLSFGSGLRTIGEGAFATVEVTSVTLPDGLETIKSSAFNTLSIHEVTIPASVTFIGNYAFQASSPETSLKVNVSDVDAWCRIESDGEYWEEPVAFYNLYKDGKEVTSVKIPEGMTSISKVFLSQTNLEKVTIPSTVTEIGVAFYWCQNLKTVVNYSQVPQSIITYYNGMVGTRALSRGSSGESYTAFENVDKNDCTLYVPKNTKSQYTKAMGWQNFTDIREMTTVKPGDANGDNNVDDEDIEIVINYIMTGKEPENFLFLNADVNEDNKVDATDIVRIINIRRASAQ